MVKITLFPQQLLHLCIKVCEMEKTLADLRENYGMHSLSEVDSPENPMDLFQIWLDDALNKVAIEPNAMTIATVGADGKPSARTVLLKGINEVGFMFFTHYTSKKGQQIDDNQYVSLLFWWRELERQVRIEGKAVKVSREKSEQYFHTRPKGSQLGAVASPQSKIITRAQLEANYNEVEEQYKDVPEVPLPENWGGYIVVPELIEFWQGRQNRLHDRVEYIYEGQAWKRYRLAP
jgi:pyridoxamine 5'-phosphate oxidase